MAGEGSGTQESQNQVGTVTPDTPFDVNAHVPEALRGEAYFGSFKGKTLGDVIKSGLEAHKTVGGSVRIPGADAKDEEWNGFYGKLRPAKADDYKIEFKKEIGIQESVTKALREAAFNAGMHPRQATYFFKAYEDMAVAEQQNLKNQLETETQAGLDAIKKQHGSDFERMNVMANRAVRRFGGDDGIKLVRDYGLTADPVFFKMFANIAQAIHEDSWVGGETPKFVSKDDAQRRITEIYADKTHAYHSAQAPGHDAAVKQVDSLRRIVHGAKEDEE